jgi:hypothetical protein
LNNQVSTEHELIQLLLKIFKNAYLRFKDHCESDPRYLDLPSSGNALGDMINAEISNHAGSSKLSNPHNSYKFQILSFGKFIVHRRQRKNKFNPKNAIGLMALGNVPILKESFPDIQDTRQLKLNLFDLFNSESEQRLLLCIEHFTKREHRPYINIWVPNGLNEPILLNPNPIYLEELEVTSVSKQIASAIVPKLKRQPKTHHA